MILRRFHPVPLTLALLLGLAGCGSTPEEPVVSPPSVVASSSPVVSQSPTPDMDALYAEAEQVLRRWVELEKGYELTGDFSEYPPGLQEVLAEPVLGLSRNNFEVAKENGWRAKPGSQPRVTSEPATGMRMDDSEVALRICLDTTDAPMVDASGEVVSPGGFQVLVFYFKYFDEDLKIFATSSYELVTACPFE
ncbi:MAG: hypothetical protein ACOX61_07370 [Brooklawnia sp.]|jgi:hypothetical protein